MTDTLLQHTQQAVQTGAVSGAQTGPVAQNIAKAISMGAVAAPTTPLGWEALVNQFTQSPLERASIAPVDSQIVTATLKPTAVTATDPSTTAQAAPAAGSGASGAGSGGDLQSFLYGERMAESSNNYTVGEGGAYGMIEPYWQSTAKDAGYGQYADKPAGDAPPEVQDAVASWLAQQNYQKYGSWGAAAQAWYNPATVGQDGYTPPGNVLTMGQYSQRVLNFMSQAPGASTTAAASTGSTTAAGSTGDMGSITAINFAKSKLGENYVWGGESDAGWDCSGLVQASYAAAGIQLPRVAQDQYNATTKVPAGQEQPGDLVFFGTSPTDISHVGIYIGNGQMIDAPNSQSVVRTENYQWGDYIGATRPADATGQSVQVATQTAGAGSQNTMPSGAESLASYYQALEHVNSALTMKGA